MWTRQLKSVFVDYLVVLVKFTAYRGGCPNAQMSTVTVDKLLPPAAHGHGDSANMNQKSGTGAAGPKYVIDEVPDPSTGLAWEEEKKTGIKAAFQSFFAQRTISPGEKVSNTSTVNEFLKVVRTSDKIDVWPFIVGVPILAGMAGLSGAFVNYQFRKLLFLGEHGRVSSFIALGIVPASTTMLMHTTGITYSMATDPYQCPICSQLRAGVMQAGMAVLYPFFLAPLLALPISKKLARYSVPKMTPQNVPVILKFIRDLIAPAKTKLMGLIALNMMMGMGMTYAEQYYFYKNVRPELLRRAELKSKAAPPLGQPRSVIAD